MKAVLVSTGVKTSGSRSGVVERNVSWHRYTPGKGPPVSRRDDLLETVNETRDQS